MEFNAGLNGILGPNGSGKTSAVNLGLFGGLTNQFTRHAAGRKGCIRQGAKSARIDIEFADDAMTRVTRTLQAGSTKSEMRWYPDPQNIATEEQLMQDTEIQARLSSVFGLEKSVLERFVFVEQGTVAAFLDETEANWAKTIAFLCKTQYLEDIWSVLGIAIVSRQSALSAVEALDLKQTQESIATAVQELEGLKQDVEDCEQRLASLPLKEVCDKAIADSRADELLDVDIRSNEERLVRDRQAYANREKMLKEDQLSLQNIAAEQAKYEAECFQLDYQTSEKHLTQVSNSANVNKLHIKCNELQTSLVTLCQKLEGCRYSEEDRNSRARELDELKFQLAKLDLKMKVVNKGVDRCPICEASLENQRISSIDEVVKEHAHVLSSIADCENALKEISRCLTEFTEASNQRTILTAQLEDAQKQLEELVTELGQPVPQETVKEVNARLEQHRAWMEQSRTLNIRVKESKKYLEEFQKSMDQSSATLAGLLEKQKGREKRAQRAGKAQQANEVRAATETQWYGARLRVKDKESQLVELNRIKQEAEKAELILPTRDWIDILKRTRTALHRNSIPKLVHHAFLSRLLSGINDLLEQFQAPFSVALNDDLSFSATMSFGCTVPAKALSGGQKVLVAVSFWLTLHEVFASKVGLLVLDEPTDGLDVDNRKKAAEIFATVDAYLRNTGKQMLIITHDEFLEGVFSSVTRLSTTS
jgi:DNA repair exonuclease SbcCD ATPase subunit